MMATTIKTKNSTTAATAPTGLVQGELAVNITDKKLYVGDNAGNSIQIAGQGATNGAGGSNTQVQYNSSGALAGSSSFVFDGTNVGIGTSSPSTKLTVSSTYTSSRGQLSVVSTDTDVGQTFYVGSTFHGVLSFSSSIGYIGTSSNTPLGFLANNAERMRLDTSGNLGLGVTPSAWGATIKAFQINSQASVSAGSDSTSLNSNFYYDGSSNKYIGTGYATRYLQASGAHYFYTAASGSAGGAVSFTQAMTLDASGNLGIGTSSPSAYGAGYITATINASTAPILDLKRSDVRTGSLYAESGQVKLAAITNVPLTFDTNNTERMRITSSGSVGIGTTTPRVVGTGYKGLEIYNTSGSSIWLSANSDTYNAYMSVDSGGLNLTAVTSMPFLFGTNNTERMRIDSSGNVGIGTSSPNANLHVQGTATVDGSIGFNQQLTSTVAYNSTPQSGSLVSLKYNAGGSYAGMGGWSIGKENATDGNFAGYFAIHTRANGGTVTERARIDSSGVLLVGCTTSGVDGKLALSMDSGTNTWQVGPAASSGVAQFYVTKKASGAGVYLSSTSATSWSANSDINLKNITGKIENALEAVSTLTPAKFTWKSDETNTPQVGLIAQEVEKILPEVIAKNTEGYLSVRYTEVIPLLVAAIQELKAEVDALKAAK